MPELDQRTAAVLAESGFFAHCTGEADADRLGAVLRVGDVVTIEGAGSIHSGNWLVWTRAAHGSSLDAFKMAFTLVRNAMGRRGRRQAARRVGRGGSPGDRGRPAVSAADDRALEDLLERLRTRFYGKYRGIVSDVDPSTMRIKAKVPAVLGETETGWCMPCVPYAGPGVGFAFLPEIGSGVWIEFEGGDVSYPIWVGGYWREGEVPPDVGAAVKVIVTKAPHKLEVRRRPGSMTITDPNGNTVTLDGSGITLSRGDCTVAVSDSSVSVNNGALEVQSMSRSPGRTTPTRSASTPPPSRPRRRPTPPTSTRWSASCC